MLQSLEQAATGPIMPNHKLASTILGKQRFATAKIIRTGESPIQTSTPKQENPNINKEAPSRVKPWTEYALPNSTNPSVARPIISHTRAKVNQDVQDYTMMGPIPKSRSLRQTMARQVAPFRTDVLVPRCDKIRTDSKLPRDKCSSMNIEALRRAS